MIGGDILTRELPNDRKIQVLSPGAIIIPLSESLECDDGVHFEDSSMSSIVIGGALSAQEARMGMRGFMDYNLPWAMCQVPVLVSVVTVAPVRSIAVIVIEVPLVTVTL